LEAGEVVSQMEGVRFRIAGTGELAHRIRSMAETSRRIEFLGEIDHPTLLRETARAHAVLAWYDPQVPANRLASPNKLFEAMMLRRPVLVSDATNAAELVSLTGSGVVVPYGDRAALRKAIGRLRVDDRHAASLGENGRQAFESTYNWSANKKRLLDAYRKVS
ncbi:MAG: glycosyltransferase, partial [Thermoplasmata archaeon]|nr:glycosyltransferase [Thermoplasmata archaeon]